jgi:predicted metal-binding membrane protein
MGFEHGIWCTSSCWAAMLFPMLLPSGHFVAMVAVAVLMFCERLDPPGTPSWRLRGFGTAWCYLILRLRGALYDPAPLAPMS